MTFSKNASVIRKESICFSRAECLWSFLISFIKMTSSTGGFLIALNSEWPIVFYFFIKLMLRKQLLFIACCLSHRISEPKSFLCEDLNILLFKCFQHFPFNSARLRAKTFFSFCMTDSSLFESKTISIKSCGKVPRDTR